MLLNLHTDFSEGRSGDLVFPSLKEFSTVCDPHKDFGIVNKGKVDIFLELPCFFYDPMDVGILISGSSAFSYPAWTSGSSWFMYYWSLAWRILSITLLVCEMSAIVWKFSSFQTILCSLTWDLCKRSMRSNCFNDNPEMLLDFFLLVHVVMVQE